MSQAMRLYPAKFIADNQWNEKKNWKHNPEGKRCNQPFGLRVVFDQENQPWQQRKADQYEHNENEDFETYGSAHLKPR